jgi:DNA-binding NarL/FixJ family response regulator
MRSSLLEPQPVRAIVVDDNDGVRRELNHLLCEEGVEVVGLGADGEEAVSLALSLAPDVILLDVRMPRLDGLDAARQIRSQVPSTRIVMLSAFDDKTLVAEATSIGVDAFLVKGCPLNDLLDVVAARSMEVRR